MLAAHFATRGLEPVPVDASTGSTRQKETGIHNQVRDTNGKTNQSTSSASRLRRKYSGRTCNSTIQLRH